AARYRTSQEGQSELFDPSHSTTHLSEHDDSQLEYYDQTACAYGCESQTQVTSQRLPLLGRALERDDVELLHLEHGFHHAPGLGAVRVGKEPVQHRRHNLPRETVAVLHPATLFGLGNRRESLPVALHLCLVLARDGE